MASSPLHHYQFKLAFISLFIVWIALHYFTINNLGLSPTASLKDSIASNILLSLFCWLIANNLSFYKPTGSKYFYVLIWCLVLAAIYSTIVLYGLPYLINGNLDYIIFLSSSLTIRFIIAFLLISIMAIISLMWYNQQDQNELARRKNEAEKLTKEAELTSLREKLQPHFLFNSLNSISALTITNPQEARKMVHQLSDFLRGTLRKEDSLSSLKAEFEHLQLYLDIEKVRFGNRLNTQIEASEEVLSKNIPPMLLQPIVENAIKFGLYDTLDQVTINIKAEFETPYLTIEISNPYDAETANPNKGTGFGLSSIKRRLHLLYNRTDLLKIQTQQNHFITTIQIPQI